MKRIKIVAASLILLSSMLAHANTDAIKLATIKKLYAEAEKAERLTDTPQDESLVRRYATTNFQNVIARYTGHQSEFDIDDCIENGSYGLHLVEGNGFSLSDKHTSSFSVLPNGRVSAKLKFVGSRKPSDVQFDLVCSGNGCKIDDMFQGGEQSTKTLIKKYCSAN